ncbi:MAG: hypothetical protein ABGX16_23835 [Pirellulales bacterium]
MKQNIFQTLTVIGCWSGLILPAVAAPQATLERPTSEPGATAQAVASNGVDGKAKEKEVGTEWVRLLFDSNGKPLAMQTAIVRYVPRKEGGGGNLHTGNLQTGTGATVDLIGAVHIGDRAYYQQLNRRFRQYDALLYELVAPEGTQVPRGRGASSTNPLGAIQNAMKSMLEVEHQLEQIDYTQPNFVHADLSPQEFMQSMKKRDEGFLKMYFQMMGQSIALQSQQAAKGESTDLDLFTALFAKDRARKLKIVMAKQFGSMEALLAGLSGPDGSTLITERNKRALQVLHQQQAAGKRKLGVFYGAGHLADMHERLQKEFHLIPVKTTWIDAWDLRD